ncbi:hypothetical protein EVAR_64087_1 [Eumeta japonica]|uniref:Regulatory protein zeste n=1 Tax=Eumeta variegata TaxID=151549 RepID=A0A4C1ZGN5_EUMVA|nr:hypothetical protein EVAR_64087_1 [Eumeta japonica]
MDKRNTYITAAQKEKLIQLLHNDVELRTGKFSANFTTKEAQKRWEQIAIILNSMIGAKKTWKLWRKTWQDLQSKSKAKAAKVTQAMEAAGGGPPCEELSQSEKMVIETMHPDNILGHSNVLESIVTFEEQVISEPVVPVVVVTDDPVPVIISDITQDQSREKLAQQSLVRLGTAFDESTIHRFAEFKGSRVGLSDEFRPLFEEASSNLVWDIVTCDETWIYFYDPKTKQYSTVWVSEPNRTEINQCFLF